MRNERTKFNQEHFKIKVGRRKTMKWQWKIKKLWRKLILSFLRVVKYKLYRYEKIQQDYRHKVVAEYVTSHRPVLDAGGTKSANLGLYIPNEVVTVNKAKICEPDIIADVCCLPIKPKSFNTVVAIQIFHQIPQDERECMIDNLRTVARKKSFYTITKRVISIKAPPLLKT